MAEASPHMINLHLTHVYFCLEPTHGQQPVFANLTPANIEL